MIIKEIKELMISRAFIILPLLQIIFEYLRYEQEQIIPFFDLTRKSFRSKNLFIKLKQRFVSFTVQYTNKIRRLYERPLDNTTYKLTEFNCIYGIKISS